MPRQISKDAPRPVKLMRVPRRNWSTGMDKFSYNISVPVALGEKIDVTAHFYPVLLQDGSILFKRWDPADFERWLVETIPEEVSTDE